MPVTCPLFINILILVLLGMLSWAMTGAISNYVRKSGIPNVFIILGGTNDLMRGSTGAAVASVVISIHEFAKNAMAEARVSPAHTLAITIPYFKANDVENAHRLKANDLIRAYAVESGGSTWLLDMEQFWTPVSEFQEFWSPDSIHFSKKGYDKMGFELYEVIKRHLGHQQLRR